MSKKKHVKEKQMKKKRLAFTLVELAIILVVIGLLLGVSANIIGILVQRNKHIENVNSVDKAIEALKGYAVRFGYIPKARPIENYTPQQEDPVFSSLGTNGFDAHGKALLYVSSSEVANNSTDLCSLTQTSLSVIDKGSLKNNIAFIVISGNLNSNIQTLDTIYQQGRPNVDDFPYDFSRPEEYDDIVKYVSLYELQSQRCKYTVEDSTTPCSQITVILSNNVKSYRVSHTSCSSSGTPILSQTDFIEVYKDFTCSSPCGTFTFLDAANNDLNKNCRVFVNKQGQSCYISDI